MATLTIELPSQASQTEFNLQRWEDVINDPLYTSFQGRIETDRYGRVIMSPPAGIPHGSYQTEIGYLLRTLMARGRALSETGISTADGVRIADVVWASSERLRESAKGGKGLCFERAPEICVEILSPSNSTGEITEKRKLYFDAGAEEVWLCKNGTMTFRSKTGRTLHESRLCPKFPGRVTLND